MDIREHLVTHNYIYACYIYIVTTPIQTGDMSIGMTFHWKNLAKIAMLNPP